MGHEFDRPDRPDDQGVEGVRDREVWLHDIDGYLDRVVVARHRPVFRIRLLNLLPEKTGRLEIEANETARRRPRLLVSEAPKVHGQGWQWR